MSLRDKKHRVERLEAKKGDKNSATIWAILDGDTYEVNGEEMTQAEFEAAYADNDNVRICVINRENGG